MKTDAATLKRVYAMSLAGVYPHYVAKAEKKGRTKAEVDEIIRWLTGYTQKQLDAILEKLADACKVERPPTMDGRKMTALIMPNKAAAKAPPKPVAAKPTT